MCGALCALIAPSFGMVWSLKKTVQHSSGSIAWAFDGLMFQRPYVVMFGAGKTVRARPVAGTAVTPIACWGMGRGAWGSVHVP